jgi:hypothetical protein
LLVLSSPYFHDARSHERKTNSVNIQKEFGEKNVVYIALITERFITKYIDKIQGLNNIKITFIEIVFARNDTTDRHMGCDGLVFMVTSLQTGRQRIGVFFPGRGKKFLLVRSFHIDFVPTRPSVD